jgi:beta-xylosidase
MAKINENVFNAVSEKAALKEVKNNDDEIQKYVMVYDVPKSWIQSIKKNRMTASSYLKQALREKLQRDGMLPAQ